MAYPTSVEAATYFGVAYNNLATTLTQICGISDTTVYVASTTNWPAIGRITIEDEIREYTGITSNTFTGCTPASDNTTAAEHASGVAVSLTLTAQDWNRVVTELRAAQTEVDVLKTSLKPNEIIIMAAGFNINGSSATLVDFAAGTAAKCYVQHISALKTHWFDCPKFLVPATYDGGSIDITVCFRSAATGKKHSLGIRVASVATTEPHNPDLAAAFQLYNETVSGDTIGDVKILKTTVTQANHLMVAGEIWHCKFVVEDDAGCDANATLFDWILIEWNKA